MNSRFRSFLREPLVHFLALGLAVFILHRLLAPAADQSQQITVSDAQVLSMVQTFSRTWQRPPTESELDRLIDDYIRTEVYVREALALGLDRDDLIVRRRLRQKMEFVFNREPPTRTATDAELELFIAAEADRYRSDSEVTFTHVFLDPARRGEKITDDAAALLRQLRSAGADVDPGDLGDPIMVLKRRWDNATRSEIVSLFGGSFAEGLLRMPIAQWSGPLPSAYGIHLVRVDALKSGDVPALSEIRERVEDDWRLDQQDRDREASYQKLLSKYQVERPQIAQP